MIEEELPDELENDLDDIEPVGDESQLYEHFRVVVDKGQAMVRVDKYLFERIVNASRNRIQKAAEGGFVMANGKPVKSSYKVKPLDVITVMMDRPRYENEIIPEDIPLTIVYEDPYLMVVNKPAGLVVHPGHGNYHGTLVNALAWHMKDNPDYDANDPHVGLVHRIDKDTSGLLVIAKTPDAKTNLGNQFFNKTTKRKYRALVWGIVEQDEGTIIGNIARNPKDRMQMAVMSDPTVGKHAVTHYRVLERLGGLLAPWMMYPKGYRIEGVEEEKEVTLNYNCVDPNYTDFIHAKMEEGRFFKTGEPYVMVVNRAFADWLGENPIGKSVTIDGMMGVITYRIIGIMENLLPVGNEPRIIPGIYLPFPEGYINETLYVKFRPGYVQQGIQPLKDKVQAQLSSFTPLYIENLWVDMEGYLSKVIELGSMIFWLAVFCILISALGVYSAMMLAVEKRSREMAIRKINGATLTDIAGIFCLHYLKLLIFAACIAFPLIYGTMHRWLEEYSHRITLRPDVFAAIFILMMIIMLLTIGSQLLKIIRVNPTEVLKND